ncbi:MAG: efflux RND transporter periplasmic adaptor subunit [Bacteroidales bacterium]|nr:efflux RND transporter periplasmic adaptor subunit [Bacteroidales bacterium]
MKKVANIAIVALIVLAILGTFYSLWKKSRPEIEVFNLVKAETTTIVKQTVATGKVEPRDEVNIVPQIAGIVSELLKEAGDKVEKDEIIAKIKVVPDISQLNNAETQVENAKLNLNLATQDYERVSQLYKQGVATLEEYQKSENSYNSAQRSYDSAKNTLDIVKNGVTSKYASYSNNNIKSTITGTILSVPVKVGNSVIQANTMNAGTTIATVADMSDMLFIGNIDETEVGSLKEGMQLSVTIGAIKDRKFDAVLEYISPKSTENNGAILFEIKAAVNVQGDAYVRAGYSANAEITLEKVEDIMAIPESVVLFEDGNPYVMVYTGSKGEKQNFERRDVELGLSDGINIQVLKGLDGTEEIKGAKIQKEKDVKKSNK